MILLFTDWLYSRSIGAEVFDDDVTVVVFPDENEVFPGKSWPDFRRKVGLIDHQGLNVAQVFRLTS